MFELDGEPAAQRVVEVLEESQRRRANAQTVAAHGDETALVDGGNAAEAQWAVDGLPPDEEYVRPYVC